ncbi:MAG: hypothetical protein EA411_12730 [Saprospirales bacterium]|nr:MAG: hypothetical protein EA411_12730 [Saprospirales bacterium]
MTTQQRWWRFRQFLNWYASAKTIYDIHSPGAFELVSALEQLPIEWKEGREILNFRKRLRRDRHLLTKDNEGPKAIIEENYHNSTVGRFSRKTQLPLSAYRKMFRLAKYRNAKHILELGTGSGLAHYVLRKARPEAHITSVDADPYLTELARTNIGRHERKSSFICDSFTGFWQDEAARSMPWDLIVLDGDHRGVTLLNNFHQIRKNNLEYGFKPSVFIGDIRWSSGMLTAWEELMDQYEGIALDYFDFGILHPGGETGPYLKASLIPYRYKFWRAGFFA